MYLGVESAKYFKACLDPPDPNFILVSYPQPVQTLLSPPSSIQTQAEIDALSVFGKNSNQMVGLVQALVTAINRAQGASQAGDKFWETQQLNAASAFSIKLAALVDNDSSLRANLSSAFQGAGLNLSVTKTEVSDLQSLIAARGLSQDLVLLLEQQGLSSAEVNALEMKLIPTVSPDDAAGVFTTGILTSGLNSRESQASSALRTFAARNTALHFQLADVNGDGKVDCTDLGIVKASFGKQSTQPGFDARADVNKDGVVNVLDLSMVAKQLPAGTVCQ